MKRNYTTGVTDDAVFFVGNEVENTPVKGARTLFVVGVQPIETIIELARANTCNHIYLGANHSYDGQNCIQWINLISNLLVNEFWVSLDFDVSLIDSVYEMGDFEKYKRFIPIISVKIPYAQSFNLNTIVKIDDIDFDATNPGVWCHHLNDLFDEGRFTGWDQYGKDDILTMDKQDLS
jgi:hypothetical protein